MNQATQHTEPANLIGDDRATLSPSAPGAAIRSLNPARPSEVVWEAAEDVSAVDAAVAAARAAQPRWWSLGYEKRRAAVQTFAKLVGDRVEEIAELIMRETGKARWDALGEAKILAGKVAVTTDDSGNFAMGRLREYSLDLGDGKSGKALFRPHGVMAVVGPFNFPAHLPNGHIVPALLAGNTVVFKPSDKAPAVGQALAELYRKAIASVGAPAGVVNLVHGAAETAKTLVAHDDIDGILFTGSWPVGRRILETNLDRPGRMIALELGGNNPAIVMPDADLRRAAIECARAAFVTTGQRCTCTRRVIVHEQIAERFVGLVVKIASNLIIGDPAGVAGQDVFMGPIVTSDARDAVLSFQDEAASAGGQVVMASTAMPSETDGYYVTPGIMRVDRFTTGEAGPARDAGCDAEVFGPLLRISTCRDIDDALVQANATRYGLAASIFTGDPAHHRRFLDDCRAGCLNINTGTAGASGKLPFGGLGLSGNQRPAGAYSLDYCAYPVASMQEPNAEGGAILPGMRFDDKWLA